MSKGMLNDKNFKCFLTELVEDAKSSSNSDVIYSNYNFTKDSKCESSFSKEHDKYCDYFEFDGHTYSLSIGRAWMYGKIKYDKNSDSVLRIIGHIYDITDYNITGVIDVRGGAVTNRATSGIATDLQAGYSGNYGTSKKGEPGKIFFMNIEFDINGNEYSVIKRECE